MAEAAVTSLVEGVVGTLFRKAKKEISYMWYWSKNVDDLKQENEKLTQMRGRILQKIKAAEDDGDTILDGVKEWVAKADSHISEAKKVTGGAKGESHISEEIEVVDRGNADAQISEAKEDIDGAESIANKTCFNIGMCVSLGTRYSYGKKAESMARLLKTVQEDGKPFESCVSVPTPTPGVLDLYETKNIDELDTHKSCLKRIRESIEDDSKQIIGIYGIGGVGKTTLAKEVAVEVKSLFHDVVFITVSQTVDAERIKKEVEKAAKRIKNGDKILVILDDLWRELKLDEVGIPCGAKHKNCKILLTSRSETFTAVALLAQYGLLGASLKVRK